VKKHWTYRELADEFGIDTTTVRRFVNKNGIETFECRTAENGNQVCKCLDEGGYEEFRELRESFNIMRPAEVQDRSEGTFYFIQLIPDALPNRVKLGYTCDIKRRLMEHRCAAPTLKLLDTWGIRCSWESMAIAAISNIPGTVQVGTEVFDFPDVEAALERANAFFAFFEKEESKELPEG